MKDEFWKATSFKIVGFWHRHFSNFNHLNKGLEVMKDEFWKATSFKIVDFVEKGAPIIAPLEFKDSGLNVVAETVRPIFMSKYKCFVIHKGLMKKHSLDFLKTLAEECNILFANEVFVVFVFEKCDFDIKTAKHSITFYENLYSLILRTQDQNSRAQHEIVQGSGQQSIYLGNNKALTKTAYGHKMLVDTRDLSLSPHILMDGMWESWIAKVFIDLLRPGMKVIDVGSNIGFYSLLAADKIGESGHLTCFEANPEISSLVFHNLHLNGFHNRSEVVTKAVYSHSTTLEFKVFESYLGSSSIWADDAHANAYRDQLRTINVETISLDEYFPENAQIDLIKMDVEGAEPYVLKGARRIISSNPQVLIIMEFAPSVLKVSYGSIEKFYDEISSYGLTIYKINNDSTLTIMPLAEAKQITWTDVVLKK
jgi:FkbM family methyltransferase